MEKVSENKQPRRKAKGLCTLFAVLEVDTPNIYKTCN